MSQTAECTPVNYVRFRDRISEGVATPVQVRHPGRFITTAYQFGCHGVITKWSAYTVDSGSHSIEFHVWRRNETLTSVYHLIGINVFQDAQPDANRLLSLSVPQEQQISVSPGDFVGIRTIESLQQSGGSSEAGFRIQFDNGGMYRQYYRGAILPSNADESVSTPSTLDLRVTGNFGSVGSDRSPVISATVVGKCINCRGMEYVSTLAVNIVPISIAEFGSDTTTTTLNPQSTFETSTPLPQSAIIVIAVSGSILVLVTFITIITIVVYMCCRLSKRNVTPSTKCTPAVATGGQQRNTESQLVSNPAYNSNNTQLVGNRAYNVNNTQLVNNPAYNSNNTQLVSNKAYNVNNSQLVSNPAYNTEPYYSVIRGDGDVEPTQNPVGDTTHMH